jgi:hypothetical protein
VEWPCMSTGKRPQHMPLIIAGGRLEMRGQSATAAFFWVADVLLGCLEQALPGFVLTNGRSSLVLNSSYHDVIKGYLKSRFR